VFEGPNSGQGGTETTGADGRAEFTYTGSGGEGVDSIRACFDPSPGDTTLFCSVTVVHEWREYGQYLCEQCGPGPHWIDDCSAGTDIVDRDEAAFGIDTDFDCISDMNITVQGQCGTLLVTRSDPRDDSVNFPGTRPVDGHMDVIDTELITMCITGEGLTLRAGFEQGSQPLAHSYGTIAEDPTDPATGISTFEVFFEVDLGGGNFVYNQTPLQLADSSITCVPPEAVYAHLEADCVPLYTDPTPGEGILIGNLVTASHGVPPRMPVTVCPLDVAASACTSETVSIPIVITEARPMDELSFDLCSWDALNATFLPPDCVRIEGTTTPSQQASNPDTLVYVVFETSTTGAGMTPLTTSNFGGDLLATGALPCTGHVAFDPGGGAGDVNDDGHLRPGDALCAFLCALNFCDPPPECQFGTGLECCAADVNCDGECTAGDARDIFCRYLCDGPPEACFAAPGGPGSCPNGGGCTTGPGNLPVESGVLRGVVDLRLESSEIPRADLARIPVELRAGGTLRAFMVDLTVPDQLEIVGLERAEATASWAGFGESHSKPGVVRLAGFDPEGVTLTSGEWMTMGYLVVRANADVGSAGFKLLAGYDELEQVRLLSGEIGVAPSELPTELALGAPRPNPSNGSVSIEFAIPAGAAQSVAIHVYNVEGRRVRTLVDGPREAGSHEVVWDGADETGRQVAAGLYFFRMTTNTFEETRKLVRTK
jgi:hypothetical protein